MALSCLKLLAILQMNTNNFFQYPYINQIDLHRKVTWCDKSVFYQIFVDRFHIGETKKIRII